MPSFLLPFSFFYFVFNSERRVRGVIMNLICLENKERTGWTFLIDSPATYLALRAPAAVSHNLNTLFMFLLFFSLKMTTKNYKNYKPQVEVIFATTIFKYDRRSFDRRRLYRETDDDFCQIRLTEFPFRVRYSG